MPDKAGFTLVEILVAAVIFSLVIAGLLGVFSAGNRHLMHTRERMTGSELGKFFIDPMQMDVRQDEWDATNPLRAAGPSSPVSQTINYRNFTSGHTTESVSGTNLRRVITTITWDEPSS